ncbi:MAG TPA: hypothetical protein PLY36_09990 [Spirochaetota bacterium]|nr:hypothetical protein [Spirochaetota bacterium]
MRAKLIFYPLVIILTIVVSGSIYGRESYEDYMDQKNKNSYNKDIEIRRDKPLSEINPEDREELLDELRGAVREELDQSINNEKSDKERKINQSKFVDEVRSIVKEEIEDAIRIKQSKYLNKYTVELGGFVSYQAKGVDSDENDNNNILKVFPQFAFFIDNNVALAMKGEAEFNLTTDTQAYAGGMGPQFIFGLTKKDDVCFYAEIMAGVSRNSQISDKIGYRYSNGFGLKFVLNSGVIFNAGVQLIFDNLGENVTGFQNVIVPTFGITAWF